MRLAILEKGHSLPQRLIIGTLRTLIGSVPGPILTFSYHREIFGKQFAACLQESMRGKSEWSVGERELFAAFVSKKNSCAY
jgi:hypothetical protein